MKDGEPPRLATLRFTLRSPAALETAEVLAKTARRHGCTVESGPEFGTPHQRQTCTLRNGSTRVRISGLFKDTFVTCEVIGTTTAETLSARTDAWCVQVANATNLAR